MLVCECVITLTLLFNVFGELGSVTVLNLVKIFFRNASFAIQLSKNRVVICLCKSSLLIAKNKFWLLCLFKIPTRVGQSW